MASNAQKTPLARSLNDFAAGRAQNAIQRLGKVLPCSVVKVAGAIVTVKFEVREAPFTLPHATMPVFGPEYIRYPIQVGDKGMAVAADAYLGEMSGLGVGSADLSQRANLSQLVFLPHGHAKWFPVDGNAVVLYGPNGVVLRDQFGSCTLTLTPHSIDVVAPTEVKLDSPNVIATENLSVGNGASGVFTSATGQVITVQDGIVTNIY
jgi:hypothetical protein